MNSLKAKRRIIVLLPRGAGLRGGVLVGECRVERGDAVADGLQKEVRGDAGQHLRPAARAGPTRCGKTKKSATR